MTAIFAPGMDWRPAFDEVGTADVAEAFMAWKAECADLIRERLNGAVGT